MKNILVILLASIASAGLAQFPIHGPMPGHITQRSARIWVQASGDDMVYLEWGPAKEELFPEEAAVTPDEEFGYTCLFELGMLEPLTEYHYRIRIGNQLSETYRFRTQSLWQWRTDPQDFRLVVGSCTYINDEPYDRPGKAYGGEYEIFTSIVKEQPDVMLWLGDNTYFREVDWTSRMGMVYRYTHTRSNKELQELLPSCAHYAIWDDHDFGPNDANGSFAYKDWARECFTHFWANPRYGFTGDGGEGITSMFSWEDVDVFLMDNRFYRTDPSAEGVTPLILGEGQIDWLIQNLKYSEAPFKLVAIGGQFLNPARKYENHSQYPEERQQLLDRIDKEGITGVVFLTGDRHCTELSSLVLPGGAIVYDLTVSPLTSTAYDNAKEDNTLRTEGTVVAKRNFATLDFRGSRKERVMVIRILDSAGNLQWERSIPAPGKK